MAFATRRNLMPADTSDVIHNEDNPSERAPWVMSMQEQEEFALNLRNLIGDSDRREFRYLRALKKSIHSMDLHLGWMLVNRSPRDEVALLKKWKQRRVLTLSVVNRSMKEGWIAAKYGRELSGPRNRLHSIGAEAYYSRCAPSQSEWKILRDNW